MDIVVNVIGTRDRRSGALLLAFVALQSVYLVINNGVIAPPAPDAPIEDLRATVVEHAATIRTHTLLALTSFVGLFLPGMAGLRDRLDRHRTSQQVLGASVVLILASVLLMVTALGVLGLVPSTELSNSLLRGTFMFDAYMAWVVGCFLVALFLTAAGFALRANDHRPRGLAGAGLAVAALSLLGSLWIIDGNVEGPLFGMAVASRGLWLLWIAAAGIWLLRSPAPVPAERTTGDIGGDDAARGTDSRSIGAHR